MWCDSAAAASLKPLTHIALPSRFIIHCASLLSVSRSIKRRWNIHRMLMHSHSCSTHIQWDVGRERIKNQCGEEQPHWTAPYSLFFTNKPTDPPCNILFSFMMFCPGVCVLSWAMWQKGFSCDLKRGWGLNVESIIVKITSFLFGHKQWLKKYLWGVSKLRFFSKYLLNNHFHAPLRDLLHLGFVPHKCKFCTFR